MGAREMISNMILFIIQNGDGCSVHFVDRQFCFEGIWNNYIDIQWKNMQVIFIMFLYTLRYNSLGKLTWHYEVWSTNVKYKLFWISHPDSPYNII